MNFIESIRTKASQKNAKIVFPRSSDPRVIEAAEFLADNNLCTTILLSNKSSVDTKLDVIEIESHPKLQQYAEAFYAKRKHKGITLEQALETIKDPLFFAASMLDAGDADGAVAGSVSTTGDVLRAAIQTIGLKEGSNVVSSTFLMSFDDGRVFTYGDCAVVPYPTSDQLASIAIDSAATHKALTGESPKVAMLSFSTKGSAKHERVELVTEALESAKSNAPNLDIDGELQFDAAVIEQIGQRKAPGSAVAGKANVFIFPNLDAGNIGYKITERLGGATATGPVIQGLAKPMMDLSRGCSWEDIVNTACVAALLS
ncbi:MAG: phosphate acetyltransferase [Balneolaceae bacterium]|nr:phosphate acetyltransferase [Balneolaceae bacterium]